MSPNPTTLASGLEDAQELYADLTGARVSLDFNFESENPELVDAASRGHYLAAIGFVLRFMAGGDALAKRLGTVNLPGSPADILGALETPTVMFATYATALEPAFQLAKAVELDPAKIDNDDVKAGFESLRNALVTIAGVALRGIRDGETMGWWKVTPEGYGVAAVTVLPDIENPADIGAGVSFPSVLVLEGGDEASAYEEIVRLAQFLDERSSTPREHVINNAIVNETIALLAPIATPEQTDSPFVYDATERAYDAMHRLANFVMERVPGEPSRSEGVVDTVIRVIRGIDAKANG